MEEGDWTATVVDQQDCTLSLQLTTPANAPIGLYRLSLEASTGYQGSSFVLGHFILLFNAWCPGEPHAVHSQRWVGRAGSAHGGHWRWEEQGIRDTHRSGLSEAHCAPASQNPQDMSTPVIPVYTNKMRPVSVIHAYNLGPLGG